MDGVGEGERDHADLQQEERRGVDEQRLVPAFGRHREDGGEADHRDGFENFESGKEPIEAGRERALLVFAFHLEPVGGQVGEEEDEGDGPEERQHIRRRRGVEIDADIVVTKNLGQEGFFQIDARKKFREHDARDHDDPETEVAPEAEFLDDDHDGAVVGSRGVFEGRRTGRRDEKGGAGKWAIAGSRHRERFGGGGECEGASPVAGSVPGCTGE